MSTIKRQVFDPAQARAFKTFFHGKKPAFFQVIYESGPRKRQTLELPGTLKKHLSTLREANARRGGVFMCINEIKGTRRSNKAVHKINAVYIDSDSPKLTVEMLKALVPRPHLVVRSSKGRLHAYWRVHGVTLQMFRSLQRALIKKFRTDPSVKDPARIMRMPGTLHWKDEPHLAKTLWMDAEAKPLTAEELVAGLRLEITAGTLRSDTSPTHQADERASSPDEIRDALNFIPSDDYKVWLDMGMAIHSAMPSETGFRLWTDWSKRTPEKFDYADNEYRWSSFKAKGGRTLGSLFKTAKEHGWHRPKRAISGFPADEFALLDLFAERVRDKLLFETDSARWLVFDQPVWIQDDAKAVQVARQEIMSLLDLSKDQKDQVSAALISRFATPAGVRTLLRNAQDCPSLTVKADAFDQRPDLLPVENGVIDLRDGSFRDGDPGERLMRKTRAAFDPAAKCPHFKEFIKFVTCGDEEFALYLQRALGFTVFGHTKDQVYFLPYGNTRNGKGTLFRTLAHVLGSYVTVVSPNLLSKAYSGNPQGPSPALMALRGARMYQCGEGEERHRFDTAFIKQLSGNDPITARSNYGEQTQFTPTGKLWLSANHLPDLQQEDEAMWRRTVVLPFNAQVTHPDNGYENRLFSESSGILNWLIRGAKSYHRDGLGTCTAVKKAIAAARRSADHVADWVSVCCEPDQDERIQSSTAYDSYRGYCKRVGAQPMTVQRFAKAMCAKEYAWKKVKGLKWFYGLRLRA